MLEKQNAKLQMKLVKKYKWMGTWNHYTNHYMVADLWMTTPVYTEKPTSQPANIHIKTAQPLCNLPPFTSPH